MYGEKNEVLLNVQEITGLAYKNGTQISGKDADKMIRTAWEYFCNDSFWLNPIVKLFDPGTTRSMVKLKDGREGVMVSYSGGGVTPGDSYVWIMGKDDLPTLWKMWVKVIPVGGLKASWEDWITLETGAKVATAHDMAGMIKLLISDVKGATDLAGLGITSDPFAKIDQ